MVENLGLVAEEEEEEVELEEALGCDAAEVAARGGHVMMREAFWVFDEDENGYIEAVELKRVLECLDLDKSWDLVEVEKMLSVVDLNIDGKVDFLSLS